MSAAVGEAPDTINILSGSPGGKGARGFPRFLISFENANLCPFCRKFRAYRTEVVKNTLNPEWRSLKVSIDRLCNGDLDR